VSSERLWPLLAKVGNGNAKGEYYLTDLVELATAEGIACGLAICPEAEVAGVNDRAQLAAIEATLQDIYRRRHMLNGATLTAPETVFFSADTVIGQDVVIGPHVVIGPGVTVEDGVEILAFSHLEGAQVGQAPASAPMRG
jgi:bifunctional UDP-N-acetylglucosamine pyrophosphorylase / glucosamine-1-phosphate N-acetyltransferase